MTSIFFEAQIPVSARRGANRIWGGDSFQIFLQRQREHAVRQREEVQCERQFLRARVVAAIHDQRMYQSPDQSPAETDEFERIFERWDRFIRLHPEGR
jgi:hypothetical protein